MSSYALDINNPRVLAAMDELAIQAEELLQK